MPAQPLSDLPDGRLRTDDLASESAELAALAATREAVGAADGPIERHGLRCALICERLADKGGLTIDRELLLIAGLLHDIGLYDAASRGGAYVADGAEFAAEVLTGQPGWETPRIKLCLEAIDRHHELRPQWDHGAEVELLRRADLVELSSGLIDFGIGRGWLRGLWRAVPREGTYREIGRLVGKAALERPSTLPQIFLRGG